MTTDETRARIRQQAADLRAEIEAREQRQREAQAIPPAYLSHSAGQWRVIVQGLPICADKKTSIEAVRAAEHLKVKIAPVCWNGDRAEWVSLDTIEEAGA
jgi:hypothetical protein